MPRIISRLARYILIIFLFAVIFACLLFIVFFAFNFRVHVLTAQSLKDWSVYGNFCWNAIMALSSLINVIVFVYLTLKIADGQFLQNNTVMSLQKMQFMHTVITDLRKVLDKAFITMKYEEVRLESAKQILLSFQSTYVNCYFNETDVKDTINKLIGCIESIHNDKELTENSYSEYLELKDELVLKLLDATKAHIPLKEKK